MPEKSKSLICEKKRDEIYFLSLFFFLKKMRTFAFLILLHLNKINSQSLSLFLHERLNIGTQDKQREI